MAEIPCKDSWAERAECSPVVRAARRRPDQPRFEPTHRNLPALLQARAAEHPDRLYLRFIDEDSERVRDHSYRELWHDALRGCAWLKQIGVEPVDRIAVLAGNLDHVVTLYFAAWTLGACVVPLNAAESEARKAFILRDADAHFLFATPAHDDEARRLAAELNIAHLTLAPEGPEEPEPDYFPGCLTAVSTVPDVAPGFEAESTVALLVYTSGTTGDPKGVLLDQFNLLADADAITRWLGWDGRTRMLCVLPIHHVNGIVVSHLAPLRAGGSTVLCSRFRSTRFWERVADAGATTTSLVPTLLEFLLEDGGGPNPEHQGLTSALCGAGPLRSETALAFEARFGVPLIHGYGLSETTAYNCQLPPDLDTAERRHWLSAHGFPSIGCALPQHELSIRRADGTHAASGERGEICVRGETVSRGYLGHDALNREIFRDTWFHSGDAGFFLDADDARRFYFITGRIKEIIIRGGVNYSPLEIDEILCAHPDVRVGLAIGFENRYYGEEIAGYVVPRSEGSLDEATLLAWCSERLDHARTPKVIVFGSEVPYTATGKPKRIELSRQLEHVLSKYRDTQFRRLA